MVMIHEAFDRAKLSALGAALLGVALAVPAQFAVAQSGAKDAALSLVAHTPGVRDVVDNLEVAPVSPMDDELRLRLARAIYGAPSLQRYSLDPARPIRITVVNGNVILSGVVDRKMDKDVAGIRANSVPGVFKVINDIEVAGQQERR